MPISIRRGTGARAGRHPCRRPPARRPRHRSRRLRRLAQRARSPGAASSRVAAPIDAPLRRRPDRDRSPAAAAARPAPSEPLFPAAIAALRTIRSRPIRLIGEPAKTLRKPASSSASRSASSRRGQLGARHEGLVAARGVGEAVPRADGEAIVAAIDAVADRLAEFVRDRPLMLDRQVGDAAPRIEPVGRREGVGRAGVQAGAAAIRNGLGAARPAPARASCRSRRGTASCRRSRLTRLVCLPCQPSPAASASGFSITGAVSTKTLSSHAGLLGDQPAGQRLQRLLDHVMIVGALCIDRDPPELALVGQRQRIAGGRVAHAQRDHRAHLGPQPGRRRIAGRPSSPSRSCRHARRTPAIRAAARRFAAPRRRGAMPNAAKPSARACRLQPPRSLSLLSSTALPLPH